MNYIRVTCFDVNEYSYEPTILHWAVEWVSVENGITGSEIIGSFVLKEDAIKEAKRVAEDKGLPVVVDEPDEERKQ